MGLCLDWDDERHRSLVFCVYAAQYLLDTEYDRDRSLWFSSREATFGDKPELSATGASSSSAANVGTAGSFALLDRERRNRGTAHEYLERECDRDRRDPVGPSQWDDEIDSVDTDDVEGRRGAEDRARREGRRSSPRGYSAIDVSLQTPAPCGSWSW